VNEHADSYEAEAVGLPARVEHDRAVSEETVDMLAERFLGEFRAGRQPKITDYTERYPRLADEIRRLFPMIAALEGWKVAREPALLREAVPESAVIERLGKYRCLRQIGKGGMGIVLEGEQIATGRRVAIKVLRWRVAEDSAWRTRFEQEARTASRLHHRSIVPVFEYGQSQGIYYYVMPLVDGVSLDVIIERFREGREVVYADEIRRLHEADPVVTSLGVAPAAASEPDAQPPGPSDAPRSLRRTAWRQIAKIGVQAAQALAYAHAHRTLHRDIKPGNLLLDAHGVVWITDFGLARRVDEGDLFATGAAGTLRYMAPEQLDGYSDERSDVYSLGLTMYEVLTLTPPYGESESSRILARIERADLVRPRQLVRDIPKRLEHIVRTATAKDPDQRYQTAARFAADLLRFANTESLSARCRRAWRRLRAK
jgi:serine/threonine protein kinase